MTTQWQGKRADDFFAEHGAAKTHRKLGDGRAVYLWETVTNASFGGPQVYCSADIVSDRSGVITDIRPSADSLGLWNTSRCAENFGPQ
jgi:hypothetical protein